VRLGSAVEASFFTSVINGNVCVAEPLDDYET